MNKRAIFCLVLFVLSFFISAFLNFHKIKVPYFGAIYKEIQTDVIFEGQAPFVFYDDIQIKNYVKVDKNHRLFVPWRYDKVKKIHFEGTSQIQKIIVYVDKKAHFFDKDTKEIKVDNDKSLYDKAAVVFLSFFYNCKFYIFSYIFAFLFLYNFQFKNKNRKTALCLIFLASLFLRVAQLNHPFWDDEVYVLSHCADYAKWNEVFLDPGNPPLYFILFKIWRIIVQNPDFYRVLSAILGVAFNIFIYFYTKFVFNKKTATVASFICCVNIILIYYSQELRCYMLLMLLALINSYLLFKFKNKTKIYYLISCVLILYTHFYAAFYVLYNFIFGVIVFFKNKIKLKSFLKVNFTVLLIYIPLIIFKKASLTSSFNTWIEKPVLNSYLALTKALFGGFIMAIVFVLLLVILYKKSSKKYRLFINYHALNILFTIFSATIFSFLIKPIFAIKYFHIVFPCCIVLISYIISFPYKTRVLRILALFGILLFNFKADCQSESCNHNIYVDFIRHDLDKTKANYVFMTDTVIGYRDFLIDGAKISYLPVNVGLKQFDIKEFPVKSPANIYVLNLYLSDETLFRAKNIELYKSPLGLFCKIEI